VLIILFHCADQTPDKNNLREERFILAHSFRGFSPTWQEGMIVGQLTLWWLEAEKRTSVLTDFLLFPFIFHPDF
jgi:hypothetical protein